MRDFPFARAAFVIIIIIAMFMGWAIIELFLYVINLIF